MRQLLVGQRATREMFGYTSDTLWMPDVFGYSAALPQILQGAGVRFFCTTKIAWNDTARFPMTHSSGRNRRVVSDHALQLHPLCA